MPEMPGTYLRIFSRPNDAVEVSLVPTNDVEPLAVQAVHWLELGAIQVDVVEVCAVQGGTTAALRVHSYGLSDGKLWEVDHLGAGASVSGQSSPDQELG
jgi:hypothetical protein